MVSDNQKCIMVIGGHAADTEIMGAATALKHVAAGWRAVMVHMTPGEKGHPTLSPEDYTRQKAEEARAAAEVIGADWITLPWGDGELPVSEDVQWAIADLIRQHRPDVLLTHWKGSFHRDHRNTSLNVMEALFYARLGTFRREYPAHGPAQVYYAENWEDMDGFRADLYLDVTDVWDRYLQVIRCYGLFRGDWPTFPYEQWYRGTSEMRGAEARVPRAVALMKPTSYYSRRLHEGLLA